MIAYRVVAVPERIGHASVLGAMLKARLIIDWDHDGAFVNHLRALRSAGDATHVVVLEDDAIVCADFVEHVEHLIAERPNHLLGLYVGRRHPQRVQPLLTELVQAAPPWLDHPDVTDRLRWAVGYVMPVVDIPDVLADLEVGSQHPWVNTDKRLGAWHAAHGRLSYPFPSPVQHDDDLPSTTSHTGHGRVAWKHCEGVTQHRETAA